MFRLVTCAPMGVSECSYGLPTIIKPTERESVLRSGSFPEAVWAVAYLVLRTLTASKSRRST